MRCLALYKLLATLHILSGMAGRAGNEALISASHFTPGLRRGSPFLDHLPLPSAVPSCLPTAWASTVNSVVLAVPCSTILLVPTVVVIE